METKQNWQEWKSTVLGILTFVLPILAIFYPKFTADQQKIVMDNIDVLFTAGAAIAAAISAFILVFKTAFSKKK